MKAKESYCAKCSEVVYGVTKKEWGKMGGITVALGKCPRCGLERGLVPYLDIKSVRKYGMAFDEHDFTMDGDDNWFA